METLQIGSVPPSVIPSQMRSPIEKGKVHRVGQLFYSWLFVDDFEFKL